MVIALIREAATGDSVEVPLDEEEAKLIRHPYWRAFFFRIGKGLPVTVISEEHLKAAKEKDYACEIQKAEQAA